MSDRPVVRAALAALLVAAPPGCAPTLGRYLAELDPEGEVRSKAVVVPERSPEPVAERAIVVCRFEDGRSWGERHHVGAVFLDLLAGTLSLGVAFVLDGLDPVHRKQPMTDLDRELPLQIHEHLVQANRFRSCELDPRSKERVLAEQRAGRGRADTDYFLCGEVRAFTGEWKAVEGAPHGRGPPWEYCRGRIETSLELIDAVNQQVVWSAVVSATEDEHPGFDYAREFSTAGFQNHLATRTLGAYLREVDEWLSTTLAEGAP